MFKIKKVIPDNANIFCFGDDHEGNMLRHNSGFTKLLDIMNSEYEGVNDNFGVDHGDLVEGIELNDHRYDGGRSTTGNLVGQMYHARSNREPIKDKLICILEGNHPLKLWRLFGTYNKSKANTITEDICHQLDVPYGGWSCVITYKTKTDKVLFHHYARHGSTRSINSSLDHPAERANTKKRALRRILSLLSGSCAIMSMGHTHQLLVIPPETELYIDESGRQHYTGLVPTNTEIPSNLRWYINTGSFLKTLSNGPDFGYAEVHGYPPNILGWAVIKVRDRDITGVDEMILTEGDKVMVKRNDKPNTRFI